MLEILVGPIASGKSTYCKKRAEMGAIIVNDDSIVTMLHGGSNTLYDETLKGLYHYIENHAVQAALATGRDVVVDRTNYRRQARARFISVARQFGMPAVCVNFPWSSPEESGSRRFASDARGYSLDHWVIAARFHYAGYEPAKLDEGFDNIVPVDRAYEMIQEGFWTPMQQDPEQGDTQ